VNATRTCTVSACDREHAARDFCIMHYKRYRRHGDPLGTRRLLTDNERFERHVTRTDAESCWEWAGTRSRNGYGFVHLRDRSKALAHRVAYERAIGEIPEGMVIDHLCRNRACVNPAHLQVVTNQENLRRGLGYRLRNGMDSACINGHDYTPENTYTNPNNSSDIRCRECARTRNRKRAA
jgi:hypothetical protein